MTETFDELLRTVTRSALHLEMRDAYTSAAFAAWKEGRPYDRSEPDARWHALIRPAIARGVDVRRARIVSEPVSDYIRFEHSVTHAANIAAGERVRWLPRRRASDLCLPGNDFWLFDGQLVQWNHFSGDGEWIDVERTDDPSVVKLCASAFEAVWERAIDHADYRPA